MPTPASWTDRAKVHLEEERSLPMTRPFGELPSKTEPHTAAGRALLEWAENAYAGQDQLRIWREHVAAIEAEAAAPVAQPAPLDVERLNEEWDDLVVRCAAGQITERQVIQRMNGIFDSLAAADSQPAAKPSTSADVEVSEEEA